MQVTEARVSDWRACFAKEMDRQRRTAFAWGRHDCLLGLASGAVLSLTGADPFARWRGRYSTAKGALRVLRNDGFASLADLVGSMLPEIHPSRARVGDLAAIPSSDGFGVSLGVFDASGLIVLAEAGQARVARSLALKAYRVG